MESKAPSQSRVYGTMLMGMILMSFTSPLLKIALSYGATSEAVTLYRTSGVFIFLLPVVVLNPKNRAEVKTYPRNHWVMLLCLGTFKAVNMLLWIEGLKYTSVFVASTLTRTSPIWVIIGGFLFLHEKTALKAVGGMLISFVGVALVGISDISGGGNSWLGIVLILLCAVVGAGDMLVNRIVRQVGSLWTTMFFTFMVASSEILIYSLIRKVYLGPYALQVYIVIGALTIFCTLLGQSVNIWVLKYMKAATVSIIQLVSPFIAAFTAFLILGEKPGMMTFVGAFVMIVGLYIYFREEAKMAELNEVRAMNEENAKRLAAAEREETDPADASGTVTDEEGTDISVKEFDTEDADESDIDADSGSASHDETGEDSVSPGC